MPASRSPARVPAFAPLPGWGAAPDRALIDKMIGDEVAGLYLPSIAGPDHARIAVDAARALLKATGHADPDGPWIKEGASPAVVRAVIMGGLSLLAP